MASPSDRVPPEQEEETTVSVVEDSKDESTSAKEPETKTPSSSQRSTSPIVRFYRGGVDFKGRSLDDILGYRFKALEREHDYIQVLFPLPEASFFNDESPVLDDETIEEFKNDYKLRVQMRRSFALMLRFFGFDYDIDGTETDDSGTVDQTHECLTRIRPNPEEFHKAARNWVNSHNELRITRIIRSLRCCGLGSEANSFYRTLKALYASKVCRISASTFMYWTRAAIRDLRIPPNMSDVVAAKKLGIPVPKEDSVR